MNSYSEEAKPIHFKVQKNPWSGWWWPHYFGYNPNLYDNGGPLEKYDYIYNLPYNIEPEPTSSKAWEYKKRRKTYQNNGGHCIG